MGSGTDFNLGFKSTANNAAGNENAGALTSNQAASSAGGGGGAVSSVSGSGVGINVSPTTGAVVVSNTGVTSIVAGTNISISGATGAVTVNSTGGSGGYLNEYNVNTYQAPAHAPYTVASPGGGASANTTAINYAIADMNTAGGGRLLFPGSGAYSIDQTLTTITVPCEIVGMGPETTQVVQTVSTQGVFLCDRAAAWIHGLNLIGAGGGGSGNGIEIGSGSHSVSASVIENNQIQSFATGIQLTQAINSTVIKGNYFGGCNYSIQVGALSGTPVIIANTMNSTTANIFINGNVGGGVMIIGNYLDGAQNSILFTNPNAESVDLYITDNHIEDYSVNGILIQPGGASSVMANVIINGNEFADQSATTGSAVLVANNGTAGVWLYRTVITGNVILSSVGASAVSLYYSTQVAIDGNALQGNVGPCLFIDSTCNAVRVGQGNSLAGTMTDNQTYTVGTLPSPANSKNQRYFVTNATSTTFLSIVAAGGANIVPVFSDGTNWRIG